MKVFDRYIKEVNKLPIEDKTTLLYAKLTSDKIHAAEKVLINVASMMSALEFVYPGKWDISFSKKSSEYYQKDKTESLPYMSLSEMKESKKFYMKLKIEVLFIIHFEKLTIKNSLGFEHHMYDMYIRLSNYYASDGLTLGGFQGKRFSATHEEIMTGYQHSHLPGRPYKECEDSNSAFKYRGFCTGSGQVIDKLIQDTYIYDEGKFKLFLFQLQSYLEWESIEGAPYMQIKNVLGRVQYDDLGINAVHTVYNEIERFYEGSDTTRELDFEIKDNLILIKDNAKFEEFIKVRGDRAADYRANNIVTKDEVGHIYSYRKIPNIFPSDLLASDEYLEKVAFYFRGELVEFEVIEEKSMSNKEFYLNPKIKNYVKKRIEKRIQESRFRSSILKELNSLTPV